MPQEVLVVFSSPQGGCDRNATNGAIAQSTVHIALGLLLEGTKLLADNVSIRLLTSLTDVSILRYLLSQLDFVNSGKPDDGNKFRLIKDCARTLYVITVILFEGLLLSLSPGIGSIGLWMKL